MKSIVVLILMLLTASSVFGRAAYRVDGNNVIIELDGITVKSKLLVVEIWSSRTVRIRTTMNDQLSELPLPYGERNMAPVKFKAAYAQANIEITTADIQINVAEDGIVRILNAMGSRLLVESNRTFEPSVMEDKAWLINQKFYLNMNEHVYGFGQEDRQNRYNLRDKAFGVKQDRTSVATPVMISEKGFALIWNNFSETRFEDLPSGMSLTSQIADDIDYFVINGPEWSTLVTEIRAITGQPPLLPRWAFGFHLNPLAYNTDVELQAAINQYKSLGIPIEKQVADHRLYLEEKKLTDARVRGRNQNIHAYTQLKTEYEKALQESQRTVIPTHINIPGIQRYGIFSVAGEVSQCWESLKCQVYSGINSSITGQAYWSTTLGGFQPNQACSANPFNELMVRWTQFAAFTPVFQGAPTGYEIWKAGNSESPEFMAIKKAITLRYQLLPYIYSSAWQAVTKNDNLLRSMNFDYQKEEKLHDNIGQYLFGPSILVCPVTSQTSQIDVALPGGNQWFDFWTGKTYEGGSMLKMPVSLDHIPVFVKQGSIIPMTTFTGNALDSLDAPLEIRIYSGADATFVLYEDENDGKAYQQGVSSTITFSYTEKNKTLSIGSPEGTYPEMPLQREFRLVLVSESNGIGTNYSEQVQSVSYTGKKDKVKFE
jgi:alpha-glucosidase (family GH31 glycosyl hydrolase)